MTARGGKASKRTRSSGKTAGERSELQAKLKQYQFEWEETGDASAVLPALSLLHEQHKPLPQWVYDAAFVLIATAIHQRPMSELPVETVEVPDADRDWLRYAQMHRAVAEEGLSWDQAAEVASKRNEGTPAAGSPRSQRRGYDDWVKERPHWGVPKKRPERS